jgi:hypothetical protein
MLVRRLLLRVSWILAILGAFACQGRVSDNGDAGTEDEGANVDLSCLQRDPTLNDNERQLVRLPADSWFEVPDSKLYDICKSVSAHGDGIYLVQGCRAIVSAWGGGAYDPIHRKMLIWGGGHNDYGGNELYAFDVPSLRWERLTDPSPPPFNQDPLRDGKPVSRHTYDGLQYLTQANKFFAWGGARSTDGGGTRLAWVFDLETKTWENRRPTGSFQTGSAYSWATAYDPATQKVFLHAQSGFNSYDYVQNEWKKILDFGYPPYTRKYDGWGDRRALVDTRRGFFISMGGGSKTLIYDIAQARVVSDDPEWAMTGMGGLEQAPGPGADYDVKADALVAWIGGGPYVLEMAASPKAWQRKSGLGSPVASAGRTFGRWRYIAKLNVFILVSDATANVTFYKHTAGCGA